MTKRTGNWLHLLRRHATVLAVGGFALLSLATPASAHGAVSQVAVSADVANGVVSVRAKITYLDGDPNTSAKPTAKAISDDSTVPFVMGEPDEFGTYLGKVSLPAGSWHILVTTTGSSRGVGKALVNVPAGGPPASQDAPPVVRASGYLAGGAVVLVLALVVVGGPVRRRVKRFVAARTR
jgi:hypothetical protein